MTETGTLSRAFQLAHSIYRFRQQDREFALRIVSEACNGVQVRLTAQHEADRHGPQKPSKVRWDTQQWLQLLIYYKSEEFERQQEQKMSGLTQEDMIIRYIKHLILITSRRNSFYISLGLCRLLYNYNAAETIAIYDLVFQDPDLSTRKVDAYYRGVKNKIIEELAGRFAGLIKIVQGPRGERRFQSESPSESRSMLVVDYLTRFTPWGTSCKLPTHIDDWSIVQSLQASQTSQIHSLIHPTCFSIITQLLGLETPARRLTVPNFFLEGDTEGTIPPDGAPSEITEKEAATIRRRLADLELRRKNFSPAVLRVLADGIECGRMDIAESCSLRCEIDEGITLIEILGHDEDEDLLLATYIPFLENDQTAVQPARHSIRLEGGQQITLTIREAAENNSEPLLAIEINYQPGRRRLPLLDWWLGLTPSSLAKLVREDWWRIPIVTGALLLILGLVLIFYSRFANNSRGPKELVSQVQPTPGTVTVPSPGARTPEMQTTTPGPHTPPRKSATPEGPTRPSGNTRETAIKTDKSLLDIERLYLTVPRDNAFAQDVMRRVSQRWAALNQFVITANRDEADAALVISAQGSGRRKKDIAEQEVEVGKASFQIVNISGEVIWRSRVFQGSAEEIGARLTEELLRR